ncbi:MAG: tRNA dihydrouridine synthase DusB [Clostridia bacterium]|nr:tRNA dihydrouridine synthase DusB [Clostridia bacterium]
MNKYVHELKIGNIILPNNVFMAPMAGVTDIPFRKICRQFKPSLTFTEMASTKAMEFESKKTEKLLEIMDDERPSAVQIFGSNEEVIKNTILKLNESDKIDIIDINMGCPAPKLVKNGDGAGLLLNLENVKRIVNEAVKVSKKVITVKTRKGFNDSNITAIKVAKICEDAGVSMITIHGRTREQYYSGFADLDIIKEVKSSVNIPVVGNGDITDLNSANKMFEYTGCDAIMVARGAQGNPWIFKSILESQDYIVPNEEKLDTIFKHINYMLECDDEKQANLKMRKHIAWYLKSMEGSSKIKDKINRASNLDEVKSILKEYFGNL